MVQSETVEDRDNAASEENETEENPSNDGEELISNENQNLEIAGPDRPVCGYFLKSLCRHGFVGRGCLGPSN